MGCYIKVFGTGSEAIVTMLDIAVCDDDDCFLKYLSNLLYGLGDDCGISMEVESFYDVRLLLERIKQGKRYDLIYLDIQMKEMDGIRAAKEIRELDRTVQLVYITSYETYLKQVFAEAPIGFLVKPLKEDEMEKLFIHIIKVIGDQGAFYCFSYNREEYKLPVRDILYFEKQLRKIYIISVNERYCEYRSLEEIKADLDKKKVHFLRIHKSYLVNFQYITRFGSAEVKMYNGKILPISRSYRNEAVEQMTKLAWMR